LQKETFKVAPSKIPAVTSATIAGKEITKVVGTVFGVGTVAFGPITSDKARGAMLKAIAEIKSMGDDVGADAVVSLKVTATGSGFVFFRAQTVILTGTAVKLS
jgi:uncharacterized protein YbjQ (UPF0145 family)